jgi:4-amino-4-deoxy-L-arabinose transferase-like glycosyltransferase
VLRWRRRQTLPWLIAAGVLAGLAALTRTNGVVVALAAAVLATAPTGTSRSGLTRLIAPLIVLAATALTITPWIIRDAVVFHRFVPISTEGGGTLVGTYNATTRNNHAEPAAWIGLSHIHGYKPFYRQQSAHPEPVVDAALRDDAVRFVRQHPAYLLSVLWHNTIRLLDLEGFARVRFNASTVDLPGPPAVAGAIMFYVVALLAAIALLARPVRRVPIGIWVLLVAQFVTIVFVNTETPRFRTPLEPFFLVAAACTIGRVRRTKAQTRP